MAWAEKEASRIFKYDCKGWKQKTIEALKIAYHKGKLAGRNLKPSQHHLWRNEGLFKNKARLLKGQKKLQTDDVLEQV